MHSFASSALMSVRQKEGKSVCKKKLSVGTLVVIWSESQRVLVHTTSSIYCRSRMQSDTSLSKLFTNTGRLQIQNETDWPCVSF